MDDDEEDALCPECGTDNVMVGELIDQLIAQKAQLRVAIDMCLVLEDSKGGLMKKILKNALQPKGGNG